MTDLPLPDHLARLPVTELHFTLRSRYAAKLPPFLGPTLRGALGHALRVTACPMRCDGAGREGSGPECFHAGLCAYATLFDPPSPPGEAAPARPFVLLPPPPTAGSATHLAADDTVTFGVRLFGPALEHFPALIGAVARLGRLGLGAPDFEGLRGVEARTEAAIDAVRRLAPPRHAADRAEADALVEQLVAWESGRFSFDLEAVHDAAGREVFSPGLRAPVAPMAFELGDAALPPVEDRLVVHCVTPLRLEFGRQIERHPTGRTLVRATMLRLEALSRAFFGASHGIAVRPLLDAASTLTSDVADLTSTRGLERYSTSQQKSVNLDGVMGRLSLSGEAVRELAWVFRLAEILHLGSDTVQGLGRVELEPR